MQVIVNGEAREIKVASIATLLDVVTQIEVTLPQGHIITEIVLNDKALDSNWFHNAAKIYLLDDDKLDIKVAESTLVATEVLRNSKEQLDQLLNAFRDVATAFRVRNESDANLIFISSIDNLRWFLRMLEDATILLGRPLNKIIDNEIVFSHHITELIGRLDKVLQIQENKDWVMLADEIEYEMIPAISKISVLYQILGI